MRSKTSVLALEYMPISVAGGVRKSVGGFLRYVQYRDQHPDSKPGGLDAYMRYVAHRDRTSPEGRVFGPDTSREVSRKQLVDHVMRSTKGLKSKWVWNNQKGELEDRQRAVYQLVLSPEDWRGLDLRRLARAAMSQLAEDAGRGGIGPWFGAEHHNTQHHHAHIVLAARRQLADGKFQTVLITRNRLQRMKDAIQREIDLQRGPELALAPDEQVQTPEAMTARAQRLPEPLIELHRARRWRSLPTPRSLITRRARSTTHVAGAGLFRTTLLRLRGAGMRYQHRMQRELERELAVRDREGWLR